MALFRVASGKAFAVQHWLVYLRSLFPQLGTIREADPQSGDCSGGRAGKMAEAMFPRDVDIGDGNPLGHVCPYTTRTRGGLPAKL